MLNRKKLNEKQIKDVIKSKEFESSIINSTEYTAVILTQGWCPQWTFMNSWLKEMCNTNEPKDMEISVFELIYDEIPNFNEFREFKEKVWDNWEVPYVRYYYKGKLIHQSNYVSPMMFIDNFKKNI